MSATSTWANLRKSAEYPSAHLLKVDFQTFCGHSSRIAFPSDINIYINECEVLIHISVAKVLCEEVLSPICNASTQYNLQNYNTLSQIDQNRLECVLMHTYLNTHLRRPHNVDWHKRNFLSPHSLLSNYSV